MLKLERSLSAWATPDFEAAFKQELAAHAQHLPLQQALSASSSVADAPPTVLILRVTELEKLIRVKAGVFYQGLVGGCACAGDPTPDSEHTEYCELEVDIDKASAATSITLLAQ